MVRALWRLGLGSGSDVGKIGEQVRRPVRAALAQPGGEKACPAMFGQKPVDGGLIGLRGGRAEREADLGQSQLEQSVAAAGLAVVVALGRGPCHDLDLAVIQAEATIDGCDLRLDRPLVREEKPGRTALDDCGCDGAAVDVAQRLGGEDDGGILLPQRFQPFAKLAGKALIIKGQPSFIDDQQRRPTIEAIPDPVEEIGQHRRSCTGPDQPFDLEGLNGGLAQVLDLGVKEPPMGSAKAIGPERLLQVGRLQKDGKAKSIGVCNFTIEALEELYAETGVRPVINQVETHPYFPQSELRAYEAQHGILHESWSPLGQGGDLLTDPVLVKIAEKHKASVAQVVIAWHLALGNVVIPKSVTDARIIENFASLQLTLDDEDLAAINGLDRGAEGRIAADPATADFA